MEIVCYAFTNKNKELEAPFLEYLKKYALEPRDNEKRKDQKVKRLMNLKAHLEHLMDHKGKYDLPPLAQKYKGRDMGILKIKELNGLVRIAFYTKQTNTIVLLDAFDKPKLYEKSKKLKVDKMIEKFLDQSETFLSDYIKNHHSIPLNL
jgi:hypothetical protein